MEPLLAFAQITIRLCEDRQQMKPMDGKAAQDVFDVGNLIESVMPRSRAGRSKSTRRVHSEQQRRLINYNLIWQSGSDSSRDTIQCSRGGSHRHTRAERIFTTDQGNARGNCTWR